MFFIITWVFLKKILQSNEEKLKRKSLFLKGFFLSFSFLTRPPPSSSKTALAHPALVGKEEKRKIVMMFENKGGGTVSLQSIIQTTAEGRNKSADSLDTSPPFRHVCSLHISSGKIPYGILHSATSPPPGALQFLLHRSPYFHSVSQPSQVLVLHPRDKRETKKAHS